MHTTGSVITAPCGDHGCPELPRHGHSKSTLVRPKTKEGQTCTSQKQQNNTYIDYDEIKFFIYEGNRYACMLVYIHPALVQTRERVGQRASVRARKAIFGVRDVTSPKMLPFRVQTGASP